MGSTLRSNIFDFAPPRGCAQVACSRCSLGEMCLRRRLSADEVGRFEQIVHRSRPFHAGEHLFRSGDEFHSLASVRAGCFKSYVIGRDGEEQVLGFYLPGEIIGLDAIHCGAHTANIVALDTSTICSIGFESISSMARQMPRLQSELFRIMSHRISELELFAGDWTANQRIAMFVLSLSERFSHRGYSETEFILPMSRRDIASFLRLATETVSRVLARFQKSGLLQVDRKQLRIRNIDEMRRMAQQSLN